MEEEKYDKYTKPIMDQLEKKFKFVSKIDENAWLVQSNEDSYMEAFFVHTFHDHIIMSGDYDGVMVRPYGAKNLVGWMSGATTLSYFAEKVGSANRYHECKKYSEELAVANIEEIKESMLDDEEEGNEKLEVDFDFLVSCASLEVEYEYWELIRKIENKFDMYDLYEYDPTEYTDQLVWQHKCLIFWANKVLNEEFVDKTLKEKKNENKRIN